MNKERICTPQPDSHPDEELVRKVLTGHREDFALLYERYYHKVFRLAAGMTGSSTAEDLTQEIFLRLFQKLGQFAGQSRFSTWLYRLAVNHCLNARPQTAMKLVPDSEVELSQVVAPNSRPEDRLQEREMQEQVQRALLSLQPKLRLVVILKDMEGLNYDEIAERVGCSPGTVASRLNRGRSLLAEKLRHLRGNL
ncbi:MAG: sigma-70 family RNA polymerase sigma factor [Blastocatellia bacterium]|nr:sigma-70 family RNA polymerase sigma factor [Blastocatellia bacterium]